MQDSINHLAPVAEASVEDRSQFIWRTYAHVVGAILAFAAIEVYFFSSGIAQAMAAPLINNWLLVLGGFMLASWGASHVAHRIESTAAQYAAFAFFIFVEAIIFVPLLFIANYKAPGAIESAAGVTVLGCVGLIATAMITRKDFSFLRGMLVWVGMLAMVAIVGSIIFGFQLGTWFSHASLPC
jgi:FtsH-binding integral membrane protein